MHKRRKPYRKELKPRVYTPRAPRIPYLLSSCPLDIGRGIYTGEGSFSCSIDEKRRRATLEVSIEMADKDALKMLEPCFGVSVKRGTRPGFYRIRRRGRPALEIAQTLAITTLKKQQISEALEKCSTYWKKGYRDRIL